MARRVRPRPRADRGRPADSAAGRAGDRQAGGAVEAEEGSLSAAAGRRGRLAALRARSQLIHRPRERRDAAEVLRAIGGAQAQEPRAGRLQLRARSRSLDAAAIERARTEERSIVRTWVMRGTAHLIPADDHGWLVPLFAERIARWSRRRLDKLGVSDAAQGRALAAVGKALDAGPLTRTEALAEAARVGFEANVQTRTHLAILLVVEGIACIGPDAGRESVLVAAHDWLGPQKRRGREESLAELARRYVVAFAPVTERDFALWSGLPLRDCRAGLAAISGDLDRREIAGETLIVPRGWRARPGRTQVVRLLPAYDTYLMGYASRDHAVDPDGERRVLPGGGVLRPTICVDGLLVGLWTSSRSGRRLTITLEPFAPLGDDVLDALGAEAADVGRFEAAEGTLA